MIKIDVFPSVYIYVYILPGQTPKALSGSHCVYISRWQSTNLFICYYYYLYLFGIKD